MSMTTTTSFFQDGGTLHTDIPSYVERPADNELFRHVLRGEFCYVLTARQMGKSSLMTRASQQLQQEGIKTALVDLSAIGTEVSREQWYQSVLKCLVKDLSLCVDVEQWWLEQPSLTPVQRFGSFLHDVVLNEIATQVVLFIDEIDTTLDLDFTDDFFAAIRYTYNMRASDPVYERLVFVLLGVATPTDLIKDRDRTPFNIGQSIDLQEFHRDDAHPLENGLEQHWPGRGQHILDRIFFWTNGHPYLTQRLCREVSTLSSPRITDSDAVVDKVVERLFLSDDAQKDDNLQFVRHYLEISPQRRNLLLLYRRIYREETVKEDERAPLQNRLRLIGLVRAQGGVLAVRNPIYRHVFHLDWVKKNTPINWLRVVPYAAAIGSLLILLFAFLFFQQQRQEEIRDLKQWFADKPDVEAKIYYLGELCELDHREAQAFFFALSPQQQRALFEPPDPLREAYCENLVVVFDCLEPAVQQHAHDPPALSQAMCCALHGLGKQYQRQTSSNCTCPEHPGRKR